MGVSLFLTFYVELEDEHQAVMRAHTVVTHSSSAQLAHWLKLHAYEAAYWLVLGILSSVGFGTGLHTFLLYLVRPHPPCTPI